MTVQLALHDVLTWSLQIALLVAVAAALPALLGLKLPKERLAYWQFVLVACVVLPAIRSWKQDVVSGTVAVSTRVIGIAPAASAAHIWRPSIDLLLVPLVGAYFWNRRGELSWPDSRQPTTADLRAARFL